MINGLQHVGLGVADVDRTHNFYKRYLDFRFKLNDITAGCAEMAPVVGSIETMRIQMVANARGGGILEYVEHRSSPIRPRPDAVPYGHLGIVEIGCHVSGIDRYIERFRADGVPILTGVSELHIDETRRWRYASVKDPDGQLLQLTEEFCIGSPPARRVQARGVTHVGIGVSDLDRSKRFYGEVLGFDRVLCEFSGMLPELQALTGDRQPVRFVILERSALPSGPFGRQLPCGIVKLVEIAPPAPCHLFAGRRWGDIGCMELCLDVSDLHAIVADMRAKGIAIYLDPIDIDMGSGATGRVFYIRDPDGTIIEFVEVTSLAWLSPHRFMKIVGPLAGLYARLL